MMTFQLTASRRGWLQQSKKWSDINIFQLTASRRGWLKFIFVTRNSRYFNSQPHEEADARKARFFTGCDHFNSQPHEEADSEKEVELREQKIFQLTASRRGWRTMYIQNATKHCYFNSQPHEEADLSAYNTLIQGCISTHSLTKRLTKLLWII